MRQYYRWVPPEDLAERDPLDVYGMALAHFNLARRRTPGTSTVRVYNPEYDSHGWRSTHTAVEVVTDDMPFLTDSVTMELSRLGFGVHLLIHPVVQVRRDAEGRLVDVLPLGVAGHRRRHHRVGDPRRDRPPDRAAGAGGAAGAAGRRAGPGARRRRGLAQDAGAGPGHRRRARRGSAAPRRGGGTARRAPSSPGSRTTPSPSSGIATTGSPSRTPTWCWRPKRTRGSGSSVRPAARRAPTASSACPPGCARWPSSPTCST